MDGRVQNTTAEAWREWKKRCAAGLCREDNAALLRRFGSLRFATFMKRYAASIGRREEGVRLALDVDGWHLLETHARAATNRAGKRYKDWLFARADAQEGEFVEALEVGATLLMRNVAREHLRAEHAPAFMTSIHRPVGVGGTLEDLLPDHLDPHDAMAEREWVELAARHAGVWVDELDARQRLALWARARGIPFSNARLRKRARCTEAVLHKTYQRLMHQLAAMIKKTYPDEPPAALTRLACLIHAEAAGKINEKSLSKTTPLVALA